MAGKAKGFTLIEMAITAAIVALLATVAFPMAEVAIQRSKEQELRNGLRQIREALDAYKQAVDQGHILRKAGESGYPPSLKTLVEGVEDVKSPSNAKSRLYFLRRIPREPFSKDSSIPAESTWGKRSYLSSAAEPKEGVDVFDVYSLALGAGLNGIPYREW